MCICVLSVYAFVVVVGVVGFCFVLFSSCGSSIVLLLRVMLIGLVLFSIWVCVCVCV